jgi:hypothetical protein
VSALQAEEAKLQQELIGGVSKLALPMALSKQARTLITVLDQERVRSRWLLLKDEAAAKASAIVENVLPTGGDAKVTPPLMPTQAVQLRESLEKIVRRIFVFPFWQIQIALR